MSEKKKKEEKIVRTFRTIVIKAGEEEGVIDMLIPMSTISIDRHGESIDPKGWKKHLKEFKKRSILLSSHNYWSLQNQIGELLDLQVVEEGLLARPKYYINQGNPEADWGYFLASKGMAAFSVGFIPIKWEDSDGKDGKPTRTFTEQELIEISHVTVPSNRDAIQEYQQKAEYEKEDPVVKEVIEEILKSEEASNFYDSRLIIPLKKAREMFFEMAKDSDKMPDPKKAEENYLKKLEGKLGETEEEKAANEKLVKAIITEAFKDGVKIEDIDVEKLRASIEKDEEGYKKEWLEGYAGFEAMTKAYLVPYLSSRKQQIISNVLFEDLKKQISDIELKAGAVLNTKNKSNLKKAQVLNQEATALVQAVLDSASTEEGLENEGKEKDDPAITKEESKEEDPGKDEAKEEDRIKERDKVIAEIIEKKVNYLVGKVDK